MTSDVGDIRKRVIYMSVMTKPLDASLRVSEEKTEDFLNLKCDTQSMIHRFLILKQIELQFNKEDSKDEITFLERKIKQLDDSDKEGNY